MQQECRCACYSLATNTALPSLNLLCALPCQVSEDSSTGVRTSMVFAGAAVTLPLILTYAGRGGQVILSEAAWEAVKGTVVHHPGAVRIISLGTHIVSDDFPQPMLLMEVMPNLLSKRVFQSMLTKQMIEPGYRDAPDPKDPMAIVFVKVSTRDNMELGCYVLRCINEFICRSTCKFSGIALVCVAMTEQQLCH